MSGSQLRNGLDPMERSDFSSEMIERALGHQDANPIRRAYARGEHWDERVRLMQWWADYLDQIRADAVVRSHAERGKQRNSEMAE